MTGIVGGPAACWVKVSLLTEGKIFSKHEESTLKHNCDVMKVTNVSQHLNLEC